MKKLLIYAGLYIITLGLVFSALLLTPQTSDAFAGLRILIIFFASILLTKYLIYMVLAPWHDVVSGYSRTAYVRAGGPVPNPKVSVIIPAWNEEVGVLTTVKTILAGTYRNVEIVVVNDGSTDSSHERMQEFIGSYEGDIKVRYFFKENGGKGRALNYGIERCTGSIIITIDADCVLAPQAVENFVRSFDNPKVMAAVGNVKIGNMDTILGTLQYLEFLFSFYFKKTESLLNTIYIIGGAAGAFRREVFDKVGLYNHENITEDIELSVRIQRAGMKIVYAHDALVYTEGATTMEGLMKQRLRWKRGRFQTFWEHARLFFSFQPKHNKLLSWIILPLALFGELQLFLELPFLFFLYVYSYVMHDFTSFLSGILVVGSMFFVQVFFDDKSTKKTFFYLLAPIGWLLFYISTIVEYNALVRSVWGSLRNQKLEWQKWDRKGCLDEAGAVI